MKFRHITIVTILLSALFMSKTLFAQPTLNSSEMLDFGSKMSFTYVQDSGIIDIEKQGASQVWDFSELQELSYSYEFNITIVDPQSTPPGSQFPASNYCYEEINDGQRKFTYFSLDNSKMERRGSWQSNQLNFYSDPQVEYVFPMSLGISNSDTWASDASSFGGTYDLEVVGSGTLILPNSSYNNALMVKVVLEEFSVLDVYFWYDSDSGAILLEHFLGDGFFFAPFTFYLSEFDNIVSTDRLDFVETININTLIENDLSINITTKLYEDLKFTISDVSGNIIETLDPSNGQKYHSAQKDMSHLNSGMYFLTIHSDNQYKTLKLIKI